MSTFYNLHMWDLKAARSPSVAARSAQSPPCISWHISKGKGVYWGSNILWIKQAVPCSDSCKCTCSERLSNWQESGLDWVPSDLIQPSPVQLTITGLHVLKSQQTCRTRTESKQLPCLSLQTLMHLDLKGPQARLHCQYSPHFSANIPSTH